ncbi:SPW repeat protein [Candidatus Nitrospira bockiana]
MAPQLVNAALGVWLMAAPDVLGYGGPARTIDQVLGPMIASMAIISTSEVMRPLRWANVPVGVWLILSPWLLAYPAEARWNSLLVGVLVAAFAAMRGAVRARFGGGWRVLWERRRPA